MRVVEETRTKYLPLNTDENQCDFEMIGISPIHN